MVGKGFIDGIPSNLRLVRRVVFASCIPQRAPHGQRHISSEEAEEASGELHCGVGDVTPEEPRGAESLTEGIGCQPLNLNFIL